MERVYEIFLKYVNDGYIIPFDTEESLNNTVIEFSTDIHELCDILSHTINFETHPNYYNINESTVIGSLTRIIKLYKELLEYYKQNKLEIYALFSRPLYESFIIMKYLIKNGENSQKHFRLISYKSRYDNYKFLIKQENQNSPPLKRQLLKFKSKLEQDNITLADLEAEGNNQNKKWKLDGKSFWQIHKEVDISELYSFIYGTGSDSVHGNWQEIIDFHLTEKGGGYFSYLNYEKCDCRSIIPMNTIMLEAINVFLEWNNCTTDAIKSSIEVLLNINSTYYNLWETHFGEPT